MKKLVTIMALVALALVAFSATRSYAAGSMIDLKALNNSGEAGMATLTDMGGGKTKVVIEVTHGSADPQPAHIHKGSCANLDPKPDYPLSNVVNGMSETTVDVSMAELQKEPYAINLHKSAADIATYVSCGDIKGLSMATTGGTSAGATPAPGAMGGDTMPATGNGDQGLILLALSCVALGTLGTGLKLARIKA